MSLQHVQLFEHDEVLECQMSQLENVVRRLVNVEISRNSIQDRYSFVARRDEPVDRYLMKEQDEPGAPSHNVIVPPWMAYITSDTSHHTMSIFRVYGACPITRRHASRGAVRIVKFANPDLTIAVISEAMHAKVTSIISFENYVKYLRRYFQSFHVFCSVVLWRFMWVNEVRFRVVLFSV